MTHHGSPPRLPAFRRQAFPRAAPIVVQWGDTLSINGQLFVLTPQLTPVGAGPLPVPPVPVPPVPVPVPVPPVPGPSPVALAIAGCRDAARNWIVPPTAAVPAGSAVSIEGTGFGAALGTVTYHATVPLVVQRWSDTEIVVTAPPYSASNSGPGSIDVRRAGTENVHATTLGFTVR